jgi:hypothetical protein
MHHISFCNDSDLRKLKKFIHDKWKNHHVLAIHKELMEFQHKSKNGYNFVISKNEEGEITAILGFIPLSQYDGHITETDIWLAIWKSDEAIAEPLAGVSLLKWLEKQIKPRSMGAIGINTDVKKIYNVLGYQTTTLNQYYILNPSIQKYNIAKCKGNIVMVSNKKSSYSILEVGVDEIQQLSFQDSPYKSLKYIITRYLKHPIYKYIIFGIYHTNILKAIFVTRKIEVNNSSCLRIVDIQGNYSEIGNIEDSIVNILQENNSEYIDCLNLGIPEQMFKSWGFKQIDQETIIPNYFEPFLQKNIDILVAYKSSEPEYLIFKGDSDQDRPNEIIMGSENEL